MASSTDDGVDYVYCPEMVEASHWNPQAEEIGRTLHWCGNGDEHTGAHKCPCGMEWDGMEAPC